MFGNRDRCKKRQKVQSSEHGILEKYKNAEN